MTGEFSVTVVEQDPIGLETHGLGQNLLWDGAGLSPYWGMVSCYDPDHDEKLDDFDAVGHTWEIVRTKHWNGQLAHPDEPDQFPDGLYEYQYKLEAVDDWGDRDAVFQFRPGFPEAKNVHSGNDIQSMPDDCPESIRVQAITTNLDVDESLELLQALADHIGLNPEYFADDPHEYSRIYQLERYARLDRAVAQDHLTGSGGIIDQIADFASQERGRGEYKWDHEEIEGHYQSVAIDPGTWDLLLESQHFGKHFKCYHPAHVRSGSTSKDDDPLVDPKIEISFSNDYDPDGAIDWHGRDAVLDELDEAALNILHWAGVPITADRDVWTHEDPYFDVEPSEEGVTLQSNPLPDLRDAVEEHVDTEFARADVSETDLKLAKALADGGRQHYETLADEADVGSSTVYRFLDRLPTLFESDNGIVQFPDDVTRSRVTSIVDKLRDTAEWARDAAHGVATRNNALRGTGDEPSALERWMERHGIRLVEDRRDRLKFELARRVSEREIQKIIRAGLDAAEASGLPTMRFRKALLDWKGHDGRDRRNWQLVVNGKILGQVSENAPLC